MVALVSVTPEMISIHAPRVGSDRLHIRVAPDEKEFQSTLPVWGATGAEAASVPSGTMISIHAPRVGSDAAPWNCPAPDPHFNPRSPCGERPIC